MQFTNERRVKPRVAASFDLRLGLPGLVAPARVRDISASGVCCFTDRAIPAMTQVQLVLLVPDADARAAREVVCGGAVVRSHRLPGAPHPRSFETAIFFTEMRDDDREILEGFIALARPSSANAG